MLGPDIPMRSIYTIQIYADEFKNKQRYIQVELGHIFTCHTWSKAIPVYAITVASISMKHYTCIIMSTSKNKIQKNVLNSNNWKKIYNKPGYFWSVRWSIHTTGIKKYYWNCFYQIFILQTSFSTNKTLSKIPSQVR